MNVTPDRTAVAAKAPPGPPMRIDGYTLGVAHRSANAPHGGEMHPDGDEVLYLISGRVGVTLEEESGETRIELEPGDACIVPRGVWHRVDLLESCQLVHLTPGPGGEHRRL